MALPRCDTWPHAVKTPIRTAFGFFNLVSGVALLAASVLAGLLWDQLGANFTFYTGAAFSALALAVLLLRGLR